MDYSDMEASGVDFDTDDLDAQLASLDVDKDFDLWASFRARTSNSSSHDDSFVDLANDNSAILDTSGNDSILSPLNEDDEEEEEDHAPLSAAELEDLQFWEHRLSHDEYFSHLYRPIPREERELQELIKFLGIYSLFGGAPKNPAATEYLFSNTPPYSILLKRGPVLCGGDERELILLSHGFVLAKVASGATQTASGRGFFNLQRTFDTCELYTSVDHVRDVQLPDEPHRYGFTIQMAPSAVVEGSTTTSATKYQFQCATAPHKQAWLDALARVLVQEAIHAKKPKDERRTNHGWQHQLVQTSLWAAAVTGREDLLSTEWLHRKDDLDIYHHMAPLHYATLYQHGNVLHFLLEHGANPEIQDGDGRTPMYYAQRDTLTEAMPILQQYGAKVSKLVEDEQRSELFKEVAEYEAAMLLAKKEADEKKQKAKNDDDNDADNVDGERPRRRSSLMNVVAEKWLALSEEVVAEPTSSSVQQSAQGAHGAMNDAMQQMHERGVKINDLGDKTKNLQEDAKTYGDNAKKLKEAFKQKKWYHIV